MPAGETAKDVSGWTVDSLASYVQRQFADLARNLDERHAAMTKLLDERYATQTKAVDAAFVAQQTAMQTALTAAERAVATAMLAAEKAVDKAEDAATKRFEAVNEFRGQLSDQASTFMPRTEADVRLQGLAKDVAALKEQLDKTSGRGAGMDKAWGFLVAVVAAVGGVIAIIVAVAQ